MTAHLDTAEIAAILAQTDGRGPFPRRADRRPWERLQEQPLEAQIMAMADKALAEPRPAITATDYLAFYRNGSREPYQEPEKRRRQRMMALTLAECLEGQGRFADAILDEAWAICEESTWVASAHSADYPEQLYDPAVPLIDLYSARTALALAEMDYLLEDLLHPALRIRIRHEVGLRSTTAFLLRDDYWWLGNGSRRLNNWTAVCVGATAGAALYLEPDVDRLAQVLEKSLGALQRYLQTFGSDGASNEGVGYWEFGFGYYTLFAHLLTERTGGRIDLLDDPHVRRIAAFPTQVELSAGVFVAFSDTGLDRKPQPALLHFLARRLEIPELAALDHDGPGRRMLTQRGFSEALRDLFWYPADTQPSASAPPPASYFADVQWLVARATPGDPAGLVVAAKAGSNAESHNQNDVGSFMVHWRGETLVAELGAGRYTREYFLPESRYTMLPNRSRGHSVPLVNGFEQQAGAEFRARDVRHISSGGEDALEMDLAGAYPPEAGLASLSRRIALLRSGSAPAVEARDTAAFRAGSGALESALITFASAVVEEPGRVLIVGQRGSLLVGYDAAQVEARLEVIDGVDLRGGPRTVTRIAFGARTAAETVEITLRLTPVDAS